MTLLTVRWGQRSVPNSSEEQLLASNPNYVWNVVGEMERQLHSNFEVWALWIQNKQELELLSKSFHLIFGQDHPIRRGRHTALAFFQHPCSWDMVTWGAGFEKNPFVNTWGAGYHEHKSVFQFLKATEIAGIQPIFPHGANLYELLTGKGWTAQMAFDDRFRVPATVMVKRVDVATNPQRAAQEALRRLRALRKQKYGVDEEITKGVAKNGYSWEKK